ncbi:glycosyltransferase [Vibrio chagasii]|uniref:glycosyltransferase family 4 protein n=1 Tax=Vibrio chagasii TaxID=170679 RepID=UPI0038CD9B78
MRDIVFYCTWGVATRGGKYYISDIHLPYLKVAQQHFGKVILLTSLTKNKDVCTETIPSNIEVHTLPKLESYAKGVFSISSYLREIKAICSKYDDAVYYLRTPQPFGFAFSFFKRKKSTLVYHLMSNPLEAIMSKESDSLFIRYIKLCCYMPDFLLTSLCAALNKSTCNGKALKYNLRMFLPKHTKVLDESTLFEKDFIAEDKIIKKSQKGLKLLYVGYLRSAKGIPYLMEAVRQVIEEDPTVSLTLVGEGDLGEYCKDFIDEHRLGDSITMLGHVSDRRKLIQLYRDADLFVFPSLSEGSPRVVIEAMSQGNGVIATDVGNTKNLLNSYGVLVRPKSSLDLYKAIIRYNEDEELRYKDATSLLSESKKYTLNNFMQKFSEVSLNDET